MQVIDLNLSLNVTLLQVFFKHFASKNQLPGFYISGTLTYIQSFQVQMPKPNKWKSKRETLPYTFFQNFFWT